MLDEKVLVSIYLTIHFGLSINPQSQVKILDKKLLVSVYSTIDFGVSVNLEVAFDFVRTFEPKGKDIKMLKTGRLLNN